MLKMPIRISITATNSSSFSKIKEKNVSLKEKRNIVIIIAAIMWPIAQLKAIFMLFRSESESKKKFDVAIMWSASKLCFKPKNKAKKKNSSITAD